MEKSHVRIPQIQDLERTVEIYYQRNELSNSDIMEIFSKHSSATLAKLKNIAREKAVTENIAVWNARNVNTASAFRAWGLDIADLEMRVRKLRELKIT